MQKSNIVILLTLMLFMLIIPHVISMDVKDVFTSGEGKSIGNQLKGINGTMKQAHSLKVFDNAITPLEEEGKNPTPPPPAPETSLPEKSEPKTVDTEKVEAAKEVYNMGLESFKNKKYEEARDFFIKAISYYEEYIEAYAKLGDTYEALKNEELAYENHSRCIELIDQLPAPPDETPSDEIVNLRKTLVRKTEKLRAYDDKLAEINQEFINSLLNLGTQCLTDNDYLLADEIFSLVLKIEPNNKTALENMETVKKELSKEKPDGD